MRITCKRLWELNEIINIVVNVSFTLVFQYLNLYLSWEFFSLWVFRSTKNSSYSPSQTPLQLGKLTWPRLHQSDVLTAHLDLEVSYGTTKGQGAHSPSLFGSLGGNGESKIKFSSGEQQWCKLSMECVVTDRSRGFFIRTVFKHGFGHCFWQLNLKFHNSEILTALKYSKSVNKIIFWLN